jgi:hypothetical protein
MATGTLLETLTIKITADLTEFRRAMAEVAATTSKVAKDLSDAIGSHVDLGDMITAGITAPLAIAAAQASVSSRKIKEELASIAQMQRGAIALGAVSGTRPDLIGPGGGPIIDHTAVVLYDEAEHERRRRIDSDLVTNKLKRTNALRAAEEEAKGAHDNYNGAVAMGTDSRTRRLAHEQAMAAQRKYDDLLQRQRADEYEAARYREEEERRRRATRDAQDAERARLRRGPNADAEDQDDAFERRQGRRKTRFSAGGFTDEAADAVGNAARRTGQAMRGAMGSKIAQALGLAGLGSVIATLIPLLAELAAVIGGVLAAAIAAILTPVGLLITALTALAAIFVASNWKQFREFIDWFNGRVKEVLGERWSQIVNAAKEVWVAFAEAFAPAAEDIKNGMQLLGAVVFPILKLLSEIFIRVFDAIGAVIEGFLHILADMIRMVGALLKGDWSAFWSAARDLVLDIFRTLLDVIGSLFPELMEAWTAGAPVLLDILNRSFDDIGKGAKAGVDATVGFFVEMPEKITGFVKATYEGVRDWLGDRFKALVDEVGKQVGRVTEFFFEAYDAIVGNSYVPDLVDGIAEHFGRLGAEMVEPAKGACAEVAGAFEQLAVNDNIPSLFDRLRDSAEEFGDMISYSFERAVIGGEKFSDVLRNLARDIAALVLRRTVTEPLGGLFSGVFSSILPGVVGNALGSSSLDIPNFVSLGKMAPEKGFDGAKMASGAGQPIVFNDNRVIDARGADQAAIARLERAIANDRASMRQTVIAVMEDRRERFG